MTGVMPLTPPKSSGNWGGSPEATLIPEWPKRSGGISTTRIGAGRCRRDNINGNDWDFWEGRNEGDPFGRGDGHPPVSHYQGRQQTAFVHLQQADDLLPALHP